MGWQSWACNEANQAATYPSLYDNVHKGNLCTMNGGIGFDDSSTWKPYNSEMHPKEKHLSMVSAFLIACQKALMTKLSMLENLRLWLKMAFAN